MTEQFGELRYDEAPLPGAVAFARVVGAVVAASSLGAAAVAAQHFYLWLVLHWDFQPAGAFLCIYVAMFGPIGLGLLGKQGWARELLSGLCTTFTILLVFYACLRGSKAALGLPVLYGLGAVLAMFILLWTGIADRRRNMRELLTTASAALVLLGLGYVFVYSLVRGLPVVAVLLGGAFGLRSLLALYAVKRACGEPPPRWITKYYTYSLCSLVGLSMLFPFLWMVSSSFKRPQETFTSSSFLPRRHVAAIDGRDIEVTYDKRKRRLEIVPEDAPQGAESRTVFRTVAHVDYPWYLPVGARFYYLDADTRQRHYFRIVRRLVNVRVRDEGIRKGDPLFKKRLDVPDQDIKASVTLNWKNFYGTDKHGEPTGCMRLIPMGKFFLNSLLIAIVATFGTVLTSSLAGYAFARIQFPGRDKLFLGYLATLMIPATVTLIPRFILVKMLGWLDTYAALIVPAMFGSAGGTFLLRQFFMGIPKEVEDAAAIDGCGKLAIYWRIMLPMSMPAMATLTLFTFQGNWNSFLWPLIILNSPEKMTLPVGLQYFMGLYGADYSLLMAGSLVSVIPMILVFIIGQKYFIKGIRIGAVKG